MDCTHIPALRIEGECAGCAWERERAARVELIRACRLAIELLSSGPISHHSSAAIGALRKALDAGRRRTT